MFDGQVFEKGFGMLVKRSDGSEQLAAANASQTQNGMADAPSFSSLLSSHGDSGQVVRSQAITRASTTQAGVLGRIQNLSLTIPPELRLLDLNGDGMLSLTEVKQILPAT